MIESSTQKFKNFCFQILSRAADENTIGLGGRPYQTIIIYIFRASLTTTIKLN